jgi:hypothetical protein
MGNPAVSATAARHPASPFRAGLDSSGGRRAKQDQISADAGELGHGAFAVAAWYLDVIQAVVTSAGG